MANPLTKHARMMCLAAIPCLTASAATYVITQEDIRRSGMTNIQKLLRMVPAHVRVDFGMTWRLVKSLELGIFGQNLPNDNHAEFTSNKTTVITEIPRSVLGRIIWNFLT
jgi:hypothetical protein